MSGATMLLVGIDVGMTCTGVAYAIKNAGMEMPEPYTIQTWPGNHSSTSDKVPTSICYSPDGRITWGFQTQHEDDPKADIREWFKVFFDESEYNQARDKQPHSIPRSHAEVKQSYEEFLGKLYCQIKKRLADNVPNWGSAHIEFLFSVPTTWTKLGLTNDFKKLTWNAGFGRDGPNHRVDVSLTEAEAAAVHTFTAQNAIYSDGDVILIVDAGGGTTDLALMKVVKMVGERQILKPLDEVRGDEIGSVEIDMDFADMVRDRLLPFSKQLPQSMDEYEIQILADSMARKCFRSHKEEFGEEDTMRRPEKGIEIPGFSGTFSLPQARVSRGKMMFTNAEIQALFDRQLTAMFKLIDYQMDQMVKVAPIDNITHIVLSGGLGSSPYVKSRLIERYTGLSPHRYAPDVRVISSTRPQLAVVKGLVQDRMQKIKTDQPIIGPRKCRQSLGVVCDQLYNPEKPSHKKARLKRDSIDGNEYAENQIIWFVKQGQSMDRDSIDQKFFRTLRLNAARKPWESKIAICNSRKAVLPSSLDEDGVKILCTMKSDLTAIPLERFEKKKGKSWWRCWGKEQVAYHKAVYNIRFRLNPASVDSELWFDGNKYGQAKDLEVTWEEGANMSAPKAHRREVHEVGEADRRSELEAK